jgi:hypothetical protein
VRDKDGFKAYKNSIHVPLYPPQGVRRLAFTRSPEMLRTRKISAQRRKVAVAKGLPPRPYSRPQARGLRSGIATPDDARGHWGREARATLFGSWP